MESAAGGLAVKYRVDGVIHHAAAVNGAVLAECACAPAAGVLDAIGAALEQLLAGWPASVVLDDELTRLWQVAPPPRCASRRCTASRWTAGAWAPTGGRARRFTPPHQGRCWPGWKAWPARTA
ncbi:hypothetical protein ACFDR9_003641 [Janthinobacterium sp. CG_23.3]